MKNTTEGQNSLPSTGAAERIQARIELLHGLGREAVRRWEAAGQPIPPPELAAMAISHVTEV